MLFRGLDGLGEEAFEAFMVSEDFEGVMVSEDFEGIAQEVVPPFFDGFSHDIEFPDIGQSYY